QQSQNARFRCAGDVGGVERVAFEDIGGHWAPWAVGRQVAKHRCLAGKNNLIEGKSVRGKEGAGRIQATLPLGQINVSAVVSAMSRQIARTNETLGNPYRLIIGFASQGLEIILTECAEIETPHGVVPSKAQGQVVVIVRENTVYR